MLQRLIQLPRELGTVNALLYSIAEMLRRVTAGRVKLKKYYLVAQPVAAGELTPARRGRSIDVREATEFEIRNTEFGRPPAAIEYRLQNGCRCLVAHKGDELLGFQWFTLHDYPEDEVRCLFRLAPEDRCAWDFDIFVWPEARALPVFLRLWDRCNTLLREAGVTQSLSRIDAFNATSRRAHSRLGATEAGWAVFLVVGRLQLALFSSRPWLHAAASPASMPVWPVSRLVRRGNRTRVADPD